MKKWEVKKKLDEIIDFSGVEKFIDTPVKRYSSGMYVRLAFAVAAHLDPEILVVDEVLAVGDAEFQKKCLGKMQNVAREGRTVLFVSHNMNAILNLCTTGIHLKHGSIHYQGGASEAVSSYEKETIAVGIDELPYSRDELVVVEFSVCQGGVEKSEFKSELDIEIKIKIELKNNVENFRMGVKICDNKRYPLFLSLSSDWHLKNEKLKKGKYNFTGKIPKNILAGNIYFFYLHASLYGIKNYECERIERIVDIRKPLGYQPSHPEEKLHGSLLIDIKWDINEKDDKKTV